MIPMSGQRPATPNALQLANSRSNKQTKIIIIIKEIIKKNLSKPRKLNLTNNKKKKEKHNANLVYRDVPLLTSFSLVFVEFFFVLIHFKSFDF